MALGPSVSGSSKPTQPILFHLYDYRDQLLKACSVNISTMLEESWTQSTTVQPEPLI